MRNIQRIFRRNSYKLKFNCSAGWKRNASMKRAFQVCEIQSLILFAYSAHVAKTNTIHYWSH